MKKKLIVIIILVTLTVSCFNVIEPISKTSENTISYSILGQTLFYDDSPFANLDVTIEGAINETIQSDSSGYFKFKNLKPGSYRITVEREGYFIYPVQSSVVVTVTKNITGFNFVAIPNEKLYWGTPFTTAPISTEPTFDGTTDKISTIQGQTHTSLFSKRRVYDVVGVVTVSERATYEQYTEWQELYIQSINPDLNSSTSEGIRVLTSYGTSASEVYNIGDLIIIRDAFVQESKYNKVYDDSYGYYGNNLSVTELQGAQNAYQIDEGTVEPIQGIIKIAENMPPPASLNLTQTLDAEGYVPFKSFASSDGSFNPKTNSLDFYESKEGMLVNIENAIVVGVSLEDNSIKVLPDYGRNSTPRTTRYGLLPGDIFYHPEVITIARKDIPIPIVNIGDIFLDPISGVVDYAYGKYIVYATEITSNIEKRVTPELTNLTSVADNLTTAYLNCGSLAPANSIIGSAAAINRLVDTVTVNLRSPDIIALSGILDDSGSRDDGETSSDTFIKDELLPQLNSAVGSDAIYQAIYIEPEIDLDGENNPRIIYLYNENRVSVVRKPTLQELNDYPDLLDNLTTVEVTATESGLSTNPGRLGIDNSQFSEVQKSVAAEFYFKGNKVTVIANSFTDLSEDTPLQGAIQPREIVSKDKIADQSKVVSSFVEQILSKDSLAKVVVLGSFNSPEYSDYIETFQQTGLVDLSSTISSIDNYTSLEEGTLVNCDTIFASPSLKASYDIVHCNSEYASDYTFTNHDPIIASFQFSSSTGSGEEPNYSINSVDTKTYSVAIDFNIETGNKVYAVAIPGDIPNISGDTIRTGVDSFGKEYLYRNFMNVDNNSSETLYIDGLTPQTEYTIFAIAESKSAILSSNITRQVITTNSVDDIPLAPELFISEYLEGYGYPEAFNRVIEIANFTGEDLSLSDYYIVRDIDGDNDFEPSDEASGANSHIKRRHNLVGLIKNGETYILRADEYREYICDPYIKTIANGYATSRLKITGSDPVDYEFGFGYFNGDDQIVLQKLVGTDYVDIDQIGVPGGVNFGTNISYVRKSWVSTPKTGPQNPATNGEWSAYNGNTFSNLGFHRYDP